MRIAGGVLAIIAGVLGIAAGALELLLGIFGETIDTTSSPEDVADFDLLKILGYLGVAASVAIIAVGVWSFISHGKAPGIVLIAFSVVGGIAGGTFVGACLLLSVNRRNSCSS